MRKILAALAVSAVLTTPVVAAVPAQAHTHVAPLRDTNWPCPGC